MSAQKSPVTTEPELDFQQSLGDTAFEPNPSFNFGELHGQDRDLYQGFTPMEDIQSHDHSTFFNPVNGHSSLNPEFQFAMQSNGFDNGSSMTNQTLDPASVWPSSPGVFQDSALPAYSAESQIVQNRPHSVSQQYGQITPPDDDPTELTKVAASRVHMISAAERAQNDKSERARNAAVQRHAKTKKQRKDSQQSKTSSNSDDDVEDKKEKYREKNRLAAAKCRAKKKDNIEGIEDKHRNLSALNSALKKQVQDLRGELTSLRTVALNHQACNCRIARYNVNQARKVAMGVDGVGSPTGYGSFGHDTNFMECEHGQRSQSMANGSNPSPSMGQMSRNQSFAAPSNFAFASVTTPEEMNAIHGGEGDNEAPFANYLQSGYDGGYPQ